MSSSAIARLNRVTVLLDGRTSVQHATRQLARIRVDDSLVTWTPHELWQCTCARPACPHIDAAQRVIDPQQLT